MGAALEQHTGGVVVIRMNWPERRNALRPEDAVEIAARLDEVASTASVVILAGTAAAFCAGGELKVIAEAAERGTDAVRDVVYGNYQRLMRRLRSFPPVTMAAVDGPAIGFGADLALACDHRYIGAGGWLAQGWSAIGVIPGTGGAWLSRQAGGPMAAWEFLLSGGRLSGKEAQALRLGVAVEGSAEEVAKERAATLATLPRAVALAYKSLIAGAGCESYDQHLERCLTYQVGFLTSEDFKRLALARLAKKH